MNANEYNHLIVLGNGFDLKCGLHTTYEAFFDERFGIEEACEVNKKIDKIQCRKRLKEVLKNQIQNRFYSGYFDNTKFIKDIVINTLKDNIRLPGGLSQDQKELLDIEQNRLKKIQYTKWDAIFLFTFATLTDESVIYWNDVERIIYFVITWALNKYEKEVDESDEDIGSYDYEERLATNLYTSFTQLFSNFDFDDLGSRMNTYIKNNVQFLAPEYLRLIIEKQFIPTNIIINSKKGLLQCH